MKNLDTLIENYLQGNMSTAEVQNFEDFLKSDSNVQAEVDMQKNIVEAIKQTRRMELKSNLVRINPVGISPWTQKIAIAAVSLLTLTLVGVGIYSSSYKETTTENKTETTNSAQQAAVVLEREETTAQTINIKHRNAITTTESNTNTVLDQANKAIENQSVKPLVKQLVKQVPATFDPLAVVNEENDKDFTSRNGKTETGENINGLENSKVEYSVDENHDFLGYKYDGKNLQILGRFEQAYVVEGKLGMWVLKYKEKNYKIVPSNKEERLESHLITDLELLKKLK